MHDVTGQPPSWVPAWAPPDGPVTHPVPPPAPARSVGTQTPLVLALSVVVAALAGAAGAGLLVTLLFLGSADDIGRELGEQMAPVVGTAIEQGLADSFADPYGAAPEDVWSSEYGPAEEFAPVPPGVLGPDPVLDAYAQSCFADDLRACDDLYFESPPLSDYEEYGASCGGRVKPYAVPTCTDLE